MKKGTEMKNTKIRGLVGAGSLIVASLLLSACTGGGGADPSTTAPPATSTSASPTATGPTSAPPPASAADAIKAGSEAAKQYWATEDVILQDLGKNPERIDPYAMGDARADTLTAASRKAATGGTFTGTRSISVTQSYASDLLTTGQAPVANGFVGLTVCNDVSRIKSTSADGTVTSNSKNLRFLMTVESQYDAASGTWKVTKTGSTGEASVQC